MDIPVTIKREKEEDEDDDDGNAYQLEQAIRHSATVRTA